MDIIIMFIKSLYSLFCGTDAFDNLRKSIDLSGSEVLPKSRTFNPIDD